MELPPLILAVVGREVQLLIWPLLTKDMCQHLVGGSTDCSLLTLDLISARPLSIGLTPNLLAMLP